MVTASGGPGCQAATLAGPERLGGESELSPGVEGVVTGSAEVWGCFLREGGRKTGASACESESEQAHVCVSAVLCFPSEHFGNICAFRERSLF